MYGNNDNPTLLRIMTVTIGIWLTFSCNWSKIETTTTDSLAWFPGFEQEVNPMPTGSYKTAVICCLHILTNIAKHWHLVDIDFI